MWTVPNGVLISETDLNCRPMLSSERFPMNGRKHKTFPLICTSLVCECQYQDGYSYFGIKIAHRQLKNAKKMLIPLQCTQCSLYCWCWAIAASYFSSFLTQYRTRLDLSFWRIFVSHYFNFCCLFVTEEIQYHGGLRSRELGQAPILLCVPNS